MPANGPNTNQEATLLQPQQQATARSLELNLMEFITALLCWSERVEAHPCYAAQARRKPGLAQSVEGAVNFALRRRVELMTSQSPVGRMEGEVKRLKEMVRFLKNDLWLTLEHSPNGDVRDLSDSRLN